MKKINTKVYSIGSVFLFLIRKWILNFGCLICILFISLFFAVQVNAGENDASVLKKIHKLDTFAEVLNKLQEYAIEPIDLKHAMDEAIRSTLSNLDPHSTYIPSQHLQMVQPGETANPIAGIGASVAMKNEILTVISPLAGGSAEKQGILSGDEILKINGVPTIGMDLGGTIQKLRGKPGSKIQLTIFRKGWEQPRIYTFVRSVLARQFVHAGFLKGYYYIRIDSFLSGTTGKVRRAVNRAEKEGISGLILDLRNNSGGILEQGVQVADIFINKGIIVTTKGRTPRQNKVFMAHHGGERFRFPMIVLVNSATASAAEIVAAALQDHRRAIVIGTQTFGKGTVQSLFHLDDSAALRITTSRYYTPAGKTIQALGVTPDIDIPLLNPPNQIVRQKCVYTLTEEKNFTVSADTQIDTALILLKSLSRIHDGRKSV